MLSNLAAWRAVMHAHNLSLWRHSHHFQTGMEAAAERRTKIVVGLTVVMMIA